MSQYDKLDALILDVTNSVNGVTIGEASWWPPIAAELARLGTTTGRDRYRIIESRLQALRKRGAIRFDRPVWRQAKDAEAR